MIDLHRLRGPQVFKERWQFPGKAGADSSAAIAAARGWMLSVVSLVLLTVPSMAEGIEGSSESAISACISKGAQTSTFVEPGANREFVARDGRRFLAADIDWPPAEGASALYGSLDTASGDLPRLEAIPAGPANRWGLIPAWIVIHKGDALRLLQAAELEAGGALFVPELASGTCADQLRLAENSARDEKSGIWARGKQVLVHSATDLKNLEDSAGNYVIARGRIVSLGKTRSTRYLNFGRYWKTDLTVTLKTSDEDRLDAALSQNGWRIEDLANKTVEIRGVVQVRDGPLIALRHPEQLVVLEDKRAGRGGRNIN
ncbi:MAG: hypothetical protein AAGA50_18065 [Pseudomonadota bacterium]